MSKSKKRILRELLDLNKKKNEVRDIAIRDSHRYCGVCGWAIDWNYFYDDNKDKLGHKFCIEVWTDLTDKDCRCARCKEIQDLIYSYVAHTLRLPVQRLVARKIIYEDLIDLVKKRVEYWNLNNFDFPQQSLYLRIKTDVFGSCLNSSVRSVLNRLKVK